MPGTWRRGGDRQPPGGRRSAYPPRWHAAGVGFLGARRRRASRAATRRPLPQPGHAPRAEPAAGRASDLATGSRRGACGAPGGGDILVRSSLPEEPRPGLRRARPAGNAHVDGFDLFPPRPGRSGTGAESRGVPGPARRSCSRSRLRAS